MNATEDKRTLQDLQQLQALPLSLKVSLTKQRIRQWVNEFGVEGVYVSFSGGKDSTVLLHLVRELYPNVEAVFCDTGLEYPEIREFVKTFDNVTWLKPKMNFRKVIEKYGYPFISKEVSECVYGARKYLTSVMESATLERTNERTNERYHTLNLIESCADWESMHNRTKGGADRKYRKLRGLGEFRKTLNRAYSQQRSRQDVRQFPSAKAHGYSSDEWQGNDGEYP